MKKLPNIHQMSEVEKGYWLGWILFVELILAHILVIRFSLDITQISFYPCIFKVITGHPCLGCGGTHAAQALLEGNLKKSLLEHPAVLYIFMGYLWFMIQQTLEYCGKKILRLRMDSFLYGLVGISIIQWILKILFL